MEFSEYKNTIKSIKYGKKLPDSVYLHESALNELPKDLYNFIKLISNLHSLTIDTWNIVKFFKRDFKLSFLDYPDFFSKPFPSLKISYTINLEDSTCRKHQYTKSENPPILHRKETLLLPTHPDAENFSILTKQAEAEGLFQNTRTIGFKKNWEALLREKGLYFDGHLLGKVDETISHKKIDRHKTAIDRHCLSKPVQSLYRHNFLNGDYTFFDYGCGKGDDINILKEYGLEASGWDPVFCPDEKPIRADIVNLGFVLNIIESPQERRETLKKAFMLAKKIIVISVMLGSKSLINQFKPYGDGVITRRNTFQKYYTQTEFRVYLETTLDASPITAGPGLFYIFKDELEEQNFLVDRQRRKRNWQKLSYTKSPKRREIKRKALYSQHQALLEDFWKQCLYFGRLPLKTEYKKTEELRAVCGSLQKAFTVLSAIHGLPEFKQAERERRNDLLVHFALILFQQKKPYKLMPKSLQKDIKHFFGKYTDVEEEAKTLLFSVGNTGTIKSQCEAEYKKFLIGRFDQGHSWTLHIDYLDRLSPTLRVYAGCATHLYGDLHGVDLFKIHMQSNKVSLMRYDDFAGKPLPLLLERIKINLREQQIDFFTYGDEFPSQPLYLKSDYIDPEFNHYSDQVSFDRQLKQLDWLDISGFGMPVDQLNEEFSKRKITLEGFSIL